MLEITVWLEILCYEINVLIYSSVNFDLLAIDIQVFENFAEQNRHFDFHQPFDFGLLNGNIPSIENYWNQCLSLSRSLDFDSVDADVQRIENPVDDGHHSDLWPKVNI